MSYKPWKDLEHVQRYATHRYASWDQRWVDRKEQSAVKQVLREYGLSGLILDVPAGYGRFLSVLSEVGDVLAVDLGFFPLLYQKERAGLAAECVNARAQQLPFKDNSVDVVFCFRLFQHLHHAAERVATLREFKRVSRKWVVLSMYGATGVHGLFRRLVSQPSRITMVAEDQFEEELTEAGMKVVKKKTVIPYLHAQRLYLLSNAEPVTRDT